MNALDVRRWATDEPDRIALQGTRSWRRGELAADVSHAAAFLASCASGGFAFVASAEERTIVTVLAAFAAGVPFLPLHPRLDHAAHRTLAELAGVPILASSDTLEPGEPRRDGAAREVAEAVGDADRVAALVATSGTSGTPRIARLSRRSFVEAARASQTRIPLGPEDAWLLSMPLAHVGGINVVTRCALAGARVVLLPRFDAGEVLAAIGTQGVTHLSVVPTMLDALLDAPGASSLARLKVLLVGGAACPTRLLERCDAAGVPALVTYGMTETCSQITTSRLEDRGRRRPHHAGRPLGETRVRVVDGERILGPGETGTIEVSSPAAMLGYVGGPDVVPGALQRTGDRGYLDAEGELFVLGRADDVIVTGGENVDPLRVEALLASIPGVAGAIVAGVPDDRFGEVVGAILVLADGAGEDDARARIAASFATHERPRVVVVARTLPTADSGKPDRRAAREVLSRASGASGA